jgi:hypothetical protein
VGSGFGKVLDKGHFSRAAGLAEMDFTPAAVFILCPVNNVDVIAGADFYFRLEISGIGVSGYLYQRFIRSQRDEHQHQNHKKNKILHLFTFKLYLYTISKYFASICMPSAIRIFVKRFLDLQKFFISTADSSCDVKSISPILDKSFCLAGQNILQWEISVLASQDKFAVQVKRFWKSRNLFSKRFLAAGGIVFKIRR